MGWSWYYIRGPITYLPYPLYHIRLYRIRNTHATWRNKNFYFFFYFYFFSELGALTTGTGTSYLQASERPIHILNTGTGTSHTPIIRIFLYTNHPRSQPSLQSLRGSHIASYQSHKYNHETYGVSIGTGTAHIHTRIFSILTIRDRNRLYNL